MLVITSIYQTVVVLQHTPSATAPRDAAAAAFSQVWFSSAGIALQHVLPDVLVLGLGAWALAAISRCRYEVGEAQKTR